MNNTQITLTGLVGTTPRQTNGETLFRLVTVEGNWYTIKCPSSTADNVYESIEKGNRVILAGDLQIVDWDNGEITGTTAEVTASAIGYDLNYGTSENTRTFKKEEN